MAVEQRPYEVIDREGAYELRRYPAYLVASVTVEAEGYNEAAYAGFGALGDYIFGNNSASGSIAMTAPVTTTREGSRIAMTVPVTSERLRDDELLSSAPICTVRCAGAYVVRFTMPSQYRSVDELPVPNDPRVTLEKMPEHLAVALRFGGRMTDEVVSDAVAELLEWVASRGLTAVGEPEAAQFDAPWKPGFARHNEVTVPVRQQ